MKMRSLVPLVVAIGLAGVAAKMGRTVLQNRPAAAVAEDKRMVVVARVDLAAGDLIDEKKVRLIAAPAALVPAKSFDKVEGLANRRVATGVGAGQMIVEANLASEAARSSLQAVVPAGMRAVTIEVDEYSGLAGLIAPGAKVDLVATMIDDASQQTVARTVIQNVTVSAVDRNLTGNAKDGSGLGDRGTKRSVTLIVTPAQAEAVDLAYAKSRPRLVLRGGTDEARVNTRGVTLAELTGGAGVDPDATAKKFEAMLASLRDEIRAKEADRNAAAAAAAAAARTAPVAPAAPAMYQIRVTRGGVESTEQFEDAAAARPGPAANPATAAGPNAAASAAKPDVAVR
jgi:pilus assembly protein CpaB